MDFDLVSVTGQGMGQQAAHQARPQDHATHGAAGLHSLIHGRIVPDHKAPLAALRMMRDMSAKTSPRYARVLTIAGSDSGGGAGIQADLKTFAALGCYGMSALTALTAQNTVGVQAIHAVPPSFLKAQLESVLDDIGADAIKIGMLHAPEIVEVVAWAIDQYRPAHVVLDPVMVATSGDRLIAEETVTELVRQLFPRASLITPNLDEAEWLLGHRIAEAEVLPAAADAADGRHRGLAVLSRRVRTRGRRTRELCAPCALPSA